MSDYSKSTNFTAKDTLPTGNSGKIVKGTELDVEFTAIASAISSKADVSSPALLGTPTAPTASAGTNTTQIASTAFTKAAIDTATGSLGTMSTQNATSVAITGGTVTGITDLTVADGGTGSSSFTANSIVLGNGSSALNGNLVAPGTSGYALRSTGTTWTSQKLGLGLTGEVWNNVVGSRAISTTYTNSNTYPIQVTVTTYNLNPGTQKGISFYINGTIVAAQQTNDAGNASYTAITMNIPPSATYKIEPYSGGTSLSYWFELY